MTLNWHTRCNINTKYLLGGCSWPYSIQSVRAAILNIHIKIARIFVAANIRSCNSLEENDVHKEFTGCLTTSKLEELKAKIK